jgi:hypothetical protein
MIWLAQGGNETNVQHEGDPGIYRRIQLTDPKKQAVRLYEFIQLVPDGIQWQDLIALIKITFFRTQGTSLISKELSV